MKTLVVSALFAVCLAAASHDAIAQTWVPLDTGVPPGTPATIVLDTGASSPTQTWIEIHSYGYWRTAMTGPGGQQYFKVEVPGLGQYGQEGAPGLPAYRVRIGVVTGAPAIAHVSTQILAQQLHNGVLVYPTPKEELDEDPDPGPGPGDPDGTPESFVADAAIYGANAFWPPANTTGITPTSPGFGNIATGEIGVYPFRTNPQTKQLECSSLMRIRFDHPGAAVVQPALTAELEKLVSATCLNWPEIDPWITSNTPQVGNRYLIVTPSQYLPTLAPFIDYRKSCGFTVTVMTTDVVGNTCAAIRAAIAGWAAAGNPGSCRYCLLVGDDGAIPLCPSPTADVKMGDDAYGSPSGIADLQEEVYVGRLSIDSSTDLQNQLDKLYAYEIGAHPGDPYNVAVLVAHKQGAPGKYEGAQEVVANAVYAVPPTFQKVYGSSFTSSNLAIRAKLGAGAGLLAYRGHGSTNTFYDWNVLGEDFHKDELLLVNNDPIQPVVWSFSCSNSNIPYGANSTDCLAEAWLERPDHGAVAHYGSTMASGTSQNHVLDREMFKAVYGIGLTTHAHAIAYAEAKMNQEVPGLNSWMYMLLGDPVMKIRRKQVKPLGLTTPPSVPVCSGPSCTFTVVVKDAAGNPQPGVLVSAWKPSWPPTGADEILASATTGTSGVAQIPLGPQTLGTINVTGRDDDGNIATGKIKVTTGPWTSLDGAKYGGNGKTPALGGTGSLVVGKPASIEMYDAPANRMAVLFVSTSDTPTPFYDGTLHTLPVVASIALATDAQGALILPIAAWPATIPSAATLVLQYAIDDPGATFGIGLSNGLRADTP